MQLFFSILLSIVFIGFMALFFISLNRFFKAGKVRIIIVIILFVIAFTIYYIGYYNQDALIRGASKAFLSSVQMLLLNNNLDGLENPIIADHEIFSAILSLASVASFTILAQSLVSTLFKDLSVKWMIKFSRASKFLVVYGYDESCDSLIDQMKVYKDTAFNPIFVIDDISKKNEIINKGHTFFSNKNLLKTVTRHPHEYVYFFFLSDEKKNIQNFHAIFDKLDVNDTCYISVNNNNLLEKFYQNDKAHINIIDLSTLHIQEAMSIHPIIDQIEVDIKHVTVKKSIRTFIGGMTPLAKSFLTYFIMNTQFVDHLPIIDIHAENVRLYEGMLLNNNPDIEIASKLNFYDTPLGSISYMQDLTQIANELDYVVFAYEDQQMNFDLAVAFTKKCIYLNINLPHIIVYTKDDYFVQMLEKDNRFKNIICTGYQKSKLEDALVFDIDKDAKKFHNFYETYLFEQQKAIGKTYEIKSFESSPNWNRYSNRYVLSSLALKLKVLGLTELDIMTKYPDSESFKAYIDAISPQALHRMSIMEHLRWNALHVTHGWTKMSIEECKERIATNKILSEQGKDLIYNQKDMALLKQVCLMPYEELPKLVPLLNRDFQVYDTEFILLIPHIIISKASRELETSNLK